MGERAWVKSIGKRLRDTLGDCPTLPPQTLHLLDETPQKEQREELSIEGNKLA